MHTVPGPVTNLVVEDINSTAIRVSWSRPDTANGIITSYRIRYAIEGGESSTGLTVVNITDVDENVDMYSQIISGLMTFTRYSVTVSANTSMGEGDSQTISVSTDPAASSPPTSLSTSVLNSTAIRLIWSYPNEPRGLIRGYIVRQSSTEMDLGDAAIITNILLNVVDDNQTQMIDIGGLEPFTEYFFGVRAFSFEEDPFFVHEGMDSIVSNTTAEAGKNSISQRASLSPSNPPKVLVPKLDTVGKEMRKS